MIDYGKSRKKKQADSAVTEQQKTQQQWEKERQMPAPWLSLFLVYGIAALLGIGAFFGYRCYYESQNDGFLAGTTVDGLDASGHTIRETIAMIQDKYADSEIVLTENDEVDLKGGFAYYGYTVDEEELTDLLGKDFTESKGNWQSIVMSLLGLYEDTIDIDLKFDEDVFKKNVNSKTLGVERFPSEDAYLYCNDETRSAEIMPEVQGNEIEDEVLQSFVKDCVDRTLEAEDFHQEYVFPAKSCVKPEVYRDDKDLVTRQKALNKYAGAEVTYDFGDKKEKLDLFALAELMDIDGENAELNEEKVEEFVSDLASKYNTRYLDRTFHTSFDQDVEIAAKYNDYGYTIIEDEEAEQLYEDIESREPVEREPIYYETNSWGNPNYLRRSGEDDMAGTYIEVDLTAQHMWYYRDGELYLDSPVVSGDVTKGRGTQTGCFPLAYKESPSVLTGGQGDGEYETEVTYWMPFYEGQGLHDADWRYSFGGSIYRGNGSHGCVNLPVSVAAELYNAVETGTAIVIYYE